MVNPIHNINLYSNGSIEQVKMPPAGRTFCVVLHGFELKDPNNYLNDVQHYYKNQPGIMARPCATRAKYFRPTEMTKAIQEMQFAIFKQTAGDIMTEDDLKDAHRSIWLDGRGYNDHGAALGTNFILKPDGDPPGFSMNPIFGDGAILEITDHATTLGYEIDRRGEKDYFGLTEPCWPISMMNAKEMDYTSTPERDPQWWHCATIARREGDIIPYQQLRGRDVWMPNLSPNQNVNWIPCKNVRVLGPQEPFPSPYVRGAFAIKHGLVLR